MTYRVLWAPHAEEQLESILGRAPELAEVAKKIDARLMKRPKSFGESRYDAVRVAFPHPLAVHFEVMDDVRTVVVYDVWRIDHK
jgi:hypothetical protein